METEQLREARWWQAEKEGLVRCSLCPRGCIIAPGKRGYCAVRENRGGRLFSLSYGRPVSLAIDPIEKKPLKQFMPGSKTFSFGTFGCNLGCVFCQNDTLSRGAYPDLQKTQYVTPEQMVAAAQRYRCPSLSFTYNEPGVFAEYAVDIARLSHSAGLANVLVSNGYLGEAAASELYPLLDAANIDMKGFSEHYYQEMCGASLRPVLDSLVRLKKLGVHLEVTTLVVPGKNDDDTSLNQWLDWAEENLGREIPLHFSAYHPAHRCSIPPTPPASLYHIREIAEKRGFPFVYLGNI